MNLDSLASLLTNSIGRSRAILAANTHRLSLNALLYLGVSFAGFCAICVSIQTNWFVVPTASESNARSIGSIGKLTPDCTIGFQASMLVLLVILGATWLHRRTWTLTSVIVATAMCLVPLAFPYFVMIRSPVIAAEATWLQAQHDNLTWLGGDIYAAAESGGRGWKAKSYLIDPPQHLSVVRLPSWSPSEIGLHRCEDLMSWLGYTNTYCQFVQRGWAFAIIGTFLLLLATLQRNGSLVLNRLGVSSLIFTSSAALAALLGWTFPFQASRAIHAAATHSSLGEYRDAISCLQRAVELVPVLSQDTYYVAQRGVLDLKLAQESDYALLRKAINRESEGKYDQAFRGLIHLLDSHIPAVRREALRGVIRFAIQDFNSGRFESSRDRFALAFCRQPCDVKLIYMIQLQAIRESQHALVCEMRDRMYAVCEHLNFGTTKILRAVVQQHVLISEGLRGDATSIWLAHQKAKRP